MRTSLFIWLQSLLIFLAFQLLFCGIALLCGFLHIGYTFFGILADFGLFVSFFIAALFLGKRIKHCCFKTLLLYLSGYLILTIYFTSRWGELSINILILHLLIVSSAIFLGNFFGQKR